MEHRSEIRGALFGVLIRLEDRLAAEQVRFIHELIDGDEWGVALEQIADVLAEDEMVLREDERADLIALNDRMGMGSRVPRVLALCPSVS